MIGEETTSYREMRSLVVLFPVDLVGRAGQDEQHKRNTIPILFSHECIKMTELVLIVNRVLFVDLPLLLQDDLFLCGSLLGGFGFDFGKGNHQSIVCQLNAPSTVFLCQVIIHFIVW